VFNGAYPVRIDVDGVLRVSKAWSVRSLPADDSVMQASIKRLCARARTHTHTLTLM